VKSAPSKLLRSPRHHSTRKKMDRPDVLEMLQFLYICGSCANSQAPMDRKPKVFEAKASGVGMQV
jgi:hypothetical protein